jgi:hypothetical protein
VIRGFPWLETHVVQHAIDAIAHGLIFIRSLSADFSTIHIVREALVDEIRRGSVIFAIDVSRKIAASTIVSLQTKSIFACRVGHSILNGGIKKCDQGQSGPRPSKRHPTRCP